MSRRGHAGSLTVGSLRGLPTGAAPPPRRPVARRPLTAAAPATTTTAPPSLEGTALPPSRRGQRCCRTGCAGCPVGEAIRRARARGAV